MWFYFYTHLNVSVCTCVCVWVFEYFGACVSYVYACVSGYFVYVHIEGLQ